MELDLRSLNILIGANGAGKSNLLSFFKLLNEMTAGRFQQFVATSGRASSLLYFGPKVTPQIETDLIFEVENGGQNSYHSRFSLAAGDSLIFAEESVRYLGPDCLEADIEDLGAGHAESQLQEAEALSKTAKTLRYLLNRCRVYHFHDTSATADVRQSCYVGDNRWLKLDAGNLAAILLRFRQENGGQVYQRIVGTIRLIAPFFDDFELEPDVANRVMLNWREQGSDRIFGPHQFSDGTLRAICLITLLLQPEEELPVLIVVDEPELGLHPYALNVVAELFSRAALHTQILISTQSRSFLDNFDPEDVIAVDRQDRESVFRRLDSETLDAWLTEYSLGEIWEKNVIGGGPH
jgi:predicted ATPase